MHVSVLTNCSRIPVITERVQRAREVMQVTMMRQSNVTVRYIFLEAERKRNQNHLEYEKHHNIGFKLFGFGKKLTCAGYFPVFALVDVNIILQVNLYPATVRIVVEGDL